MGLCGFVVGFDKVLNGFDKVFVHMGENAKK